MLKGNTLIVSLHTEGGESLSGCVVRYTKELLRIPHHVALCDRKSTSNDQHQPVNSESRND